MYRFVVKKNHLVSGFLTVGQLDALDGVVAVVEQIPRLEDDAEAAPTQTLHWFKILKKTSLS